MKYLSYFRKRSNLTQSELGEAVGVDSNTISRYEKGRLGPSAAIANAIAKELETSVAELLNGPADSGEVRFSFVMDIREVESMEVRMNEFKLGTGDNDIFGLFRVPKDTDVEEIGRQFMNYLRAELAGDKVKRDELKKLKG